MTGTWGHTGVHFRIKDGWFDAGREGNAFSYFTDNKHQLWVVLQYDEDDDPDPHKAAGVQIQRLGSTEWEDVRM